MLGTVITVGTEDRQLQLSWHGGAVHIWAVDPTDGSVATPTELVHLIDRHLGRHISAVSMPVRIPLDRPGPGSHSSTPSRRIAAASMPDLASITSPSPSAQWFTALIGLAQATVRSRRVRPLLTIDGPVHTARWTPLAEPSVTAALEQLAK